MRGAKLKHSWYMVNSGNTITLLLLQFKLNGKSVNYF